MLVSDMMPNAFVNNNYKMNGGVHLKTDVNSQTISKCATDKRICEFCGRHIYGLENTVYQQSENEEKKSISHGEIYYNGDKKSAFHGVTIKMFCIFCKQYYDGPRKVEYVKELVELNNTKMTSLSENLTLNNDRAKTVIDQMPYEYGLNSPSINADLLYEESGSEEADPSLESDEKEKKILNGQTYQRDDSMESASDKMSREAVDPNKIKNELGGDVPFKKNKKIMIVTNGVLFESAHKTCKSVASEVPHKMDLESKIIPIGRMAETQQTYIACTGKPFMKCEKAKAFRYGAPPVAGFPTIH
ncbi:uncharacterized protein [Parasteatoda tepidariorum]|uniref:uncharacterized protein isoform X2 n=1 Tax=Parasteatoda tepidariorum TaxID=114398 RepID=UPI0039BD5B1D